MSENVDVQTLFALTRWPSFFLNRWLLVLYTPIGLLLLTIRLFVALQALIVTVLLRRRAPRLCRLFLRVFATVLGIFVVSKGERDEKARLLAANHVSVFDHFAVDLISPCSLLSVWDIPPLLRWAFGYVDLGASRGRTHLVAEARRWVADDTKPALLSWPEGAQTTSGRGLLKFSAWPWEVARRVQPVAISLSCAFGAPSTVLGAAWWADSLWLIFLPMSVLQVELLTPVDCASEDTTEAEQAAERAATSVAVSLGIPRTKMTSVDVAEAVKRLIGPRNTSSQAEGNPRQAQQQTPHAQRQNSTPSSGGGGGSTLRQLDALAMRIKAVQPEATLLAIRADLDATRGDAAATMARIRQGLVKGKPPQSAQEVLEGCEGEESEKDTRAVFQARKWRLIEYHRAKYLQAAREQINAQ